MFRQIVCAIVLLPSIHCTSAAQQDVGRLPVPDAAEQNETRELINEVYKDVLANTIRRDQKAQAAQTLLGEARSK